MVVAGAEIEKGGVGVEGVVGDVGRVSIEGDWGGGRIRVIVAGAVVGGPTFGVGMGSRRGRFGERVGLVCRILRNDAAVEGRGGWRGGQGIGRGDFVGGGRGVGENTIGETSFERLDVVVGGGTAGLRMVRRRDEVIG